MSDGKDSEFRRCIVSDKMTWKYKLLVWKISINWYKWRIVYSLFKTEFLLGIAAVQ